MIFSGFFQLGASLIATLLNLMPQVDVNFGVDFVGALSDFFSHANVIINVPIVLAIITINFTIDHFTFALSIWSFIKRLIPFL